MNTLLWRFLRMHLIGMKRKKDVIFLYEERKQLLESIRYVDLVIPEENWDKKINDIQLYKIDTFVMGDDWRGKV